jgi:hypothetical protein
MNQSSDDSQIRELLQRLKREDERHVPGFEDVLERSVQRQVRQPARRLQVAIGCCAVTSLLIALLLVQSHFDAPNGQGRPNIAESNGPGRPAEPLQSDTVAEVDIEYFHTVIDEYFGSTEAAVQVPDWSSRTDSLLAVNLEIPLVED